MHPGLNSLLTTLAAADGPAWLGTTASIIKVVIGFSLIIFVHELGHFLAAKWVGIRVDRFAIGFWYRICGWRKGEGFTLGSRPSYSPDDLAEKGYGETDYCLKVLPFGGYVKMLGQDDIQINEETGDIKMSDDPRAFTNKPVGRRMVVISAGVTFNILFAIVAFMAVFMMGKRVVAPQIGLVEAGSPAAEAGFQPGDVVFAADGKRVDSLRDLAIAIILAKDGTVRFEVQRDGEVLPDQLVLRLQEADDDPLLTSGFIPYGTNELTVTPLWPGADTVLKAGDRITHVAGQEVNNAVDIWLAVDRYFAATGRPSVPLTITRPGPEYPDQTVVHDVELPAMLSIGRAPTSGSSDGRTAADHILGFCPRQMVIYLDSGKPGDRAGLKPGDIIVQWGDVLSPLHYEIVESIKSNPGQPIPVIVNRSGTNVELTVIPQRPFQFFGTAEPRVGVAFASGEVHLPIVADTVPGTPAAGLNMPRGAQILSIDNQPVGNWLDVIRAFKAAAGTTVTVRYRTGPNEAEGDLAVPATIVSALKLPAQARIVAINEQRHATLESGATVRLPGAAAVQALLERYAGRTVPVSYQLAPDDPTIHQAEFTVEPDLSNTDPWEMRIFHNSLDPRLFKPRERLIRTSNPLHATYLGVKHTGLVLAEVYRVIKRIGRDFLSGGARTAKQISGPVGIVSLAMDRAKQDFPELLFFLAFLSVNLAVINFLPFPVVDGGLMVFLIIEKIKGKPLGIKTQMVATLVGLATIVLVFLLVTIKDITRIWGG